MVLLEINIDNSFWWITAVVTVLFFYQWFTVSFWKDKSVREEKNSKLLVQKNQEIFALIKQKEEDLKQEIQLSKFNYELKIKEIHIANQKQQNENSHSNQKQVMELKAKFNELESLRQKQLIEKSLENEKKSAEIRAQLITYYENKTKAEIEKFKKDEVEKYAKTLLQKWKIEHEEEIRADAIKRSSAVNLGKITEHFIPFMSKFPYNPKDVRFIGSPIDLIVFDGHSDKKDQITLVIVEVKTGNSKLSSPQQRIKEAVIAGRVHWLETGGDFAKSEQQEIDFKV